MFNNFFNDPIINQLSQTYLSMVNEDHSKEDLEKLDLDELKALVSEYSDKVESAKDEQEAEGYRKELKAIKDLIATKEPK